MYLGDENPTFRPFAHQIYLVNECPEVGREGFSEPWEREVTGNLLPRTNMHEFRFDLRAYVLGFPAACPKSTARWWVGGVGWITDEDNLLPIAFDQRVGNRRSGQ